MEKRKVDLNFVVLNMKNLTNSIHQIHRRTSFNWISDLFLEKLQRPETDYFNSDYVSEHLAF